MARPPRSPKKYVWPLSLIAQRLPARKSRLSALSTAPPKGSRLQRRLKFYGTRDRTFLDLLRRRHAASPSQLTQRLKAGHATSHAQGVLLQRSTTAVVMVLIAGSLAWTHLFIREKVTFAGVPYRIVNKFWRDQPARTAYFAGDRQALHNRLQMLGVEADIKDYYRARFPNEYELDQHIHQIMFDRTGYVGEAYQVDNFGKLSSIDY